MDEKITVDNNGRKFEIAFYWSPTWDDIQITDKEGDRDYSRMLVRLAPDAMRAIADQFYDWAEILDERNEELSAKPDSL